MATCNFDYRSLLYDGDFLSRYLAEHHPGAEADREEEEPDLISASTVGTTRFATLYHMLARVF